MNLTKISVSLCYFLRHDPSKIGLMVDSQGWANIDELVKKASEKACQGLTRDILLRIVDEDSKGRYSVSKDGQSIRCVQGHSNTSIKMNLVSKVPPVTLFHGTATRFIDSIMKSGLQPGTRQHVHLSADVETAVSVGRRHGAPIVLEINVCEMLKHGHVFFQAENGVWLTEAVPPKFIHKA